MNTLPRVTGLAILSGAAFFAGEAEAANVLINGSFEQGTANVANPTDVTGWTGVARLYNHPYNGISGIKLADTAGAQSTATTGNFDFNSLTYGLDDSITLSVGSKFHGLSGGSQTIPTASLTPVASLASIDGGYAAFSFSSWLSSYRSDNNTPALRIQFFSADGGTGSVLGTFTLDRGVTTNQITTAQFLATGSYLNAAEDSRSDPDYWALYEIQSTLPVGTRSVIVDFIAGTGHAASGANDWYADAIVLDVIPEPSVPLLAGLGALALLRRRRS